MHNKPLVPTRNGEAPLLAAQRRRYAGKEMKTIMAAQWSSECAVASSRAVAGQQFVASAASSSQDQWPSLSGSDSRSFISSASIAQGGARQAMALLRSPLRQRRGGSLSASRFSLHSNSQPSSPSAWLSRVVVLHNKRLVATRTGEAPVLAPQPRRWA